MAADLFRPDYAYVPGQTARHREGLFDPVRETAAAGMREADLARSVALQTGLIYLDEGFYWEAHEVLEPVWMACPPNSAARHAAQALIQMANGALKLRMGKPKAAARLFEICDGHLARVSVPNGGQVLGLEIDSIEARLAHFRSVKI